MSEKINIKQQKMHCYLYVESKTGKGFQFIPCESELFYNNLKTKIDKTNLFNTSKIELWT